MKLLDLQNGETNVWEEKGYLLPKYDREELKKKTKENPTWVHFGAGNIFRAFPAAKLQDLLNLGEYDRGVVVAESFDHEIITKAYKPYDGLSLSVVLKAEGTIEKHVVGSVTESLVADPVAPKDFARLTEIFENPSLQMVTFTITEKGYSLVNGKGEKLPGVEDGFLAYREWEEETKEVYQIYAAALLEKGNVEDFTLVTSLVDDVSNELKEIDKIILDLISTGYDMVHITESQKELHKKYKKRMKEIEVE